MTVSSSLPENQRPRSLSDVLGGTTLSHIEKLDFSWSFHFGDAIRLSAEAPWRMLSRGSILVTSEDDGQTFGLTTPVDAAAMVREILGNRPVTLVEVDPASSDLRIQIDNETVLQVLNMSSGYECWYSIAVTASWWLGGMNSW